MGTRSLTHIYDYWSEEKSILVTIYRQFDGYPTGHGAELKNILQGMTIVNGIRGGEKRKIANGMGCMAAQLIKSLKTDIGGIYIATPGAFDVGEEYAYHLAAAPKGEMTNKPRLDQELNIYLGMECCYSSSPHVWYYKGWLDDFDPLEVERRQCEEGEPLVLANGIALPWDST